MKRSWLIGLLIAGGCALAGLLLWWSLPPMAEVPDSIRLLAMRVSDGDPKATAELKALGTKAVLPLTKLLAYHDPFVRVHAWKLAPKLPRRMGRTILSYSGNLEAAGIRAAAGKALALLGPQAADAVPALLRALRDPEPFVATQAAAALGRIGKASVPGLCNALVDTNSVVRHSAAFGLGEAGGEARSAVPQLIESLSDPNAGVRSTSAYSLSLIGSQVIAGLSNVIGHAEAPDRSAAARELVGFCQSLCGLTPIASKMEHQGNADDYRIALGLFGFVRTVDNQGLRALESALEDSDEAVRRTAVQGLVELNWRAQAAGPAFRKRLQDPSASVREWAARGLGGLGPRAASAAEDLRAAEQDQDPGVRAAAQKALALVEPKTLPVK